MIQNVYNESINSQDILMKLNQKLNISKLSKDKISIKLSEIEYKVLFLLYLGQTYTKIAQIISILANKSLSSGAVMLVIQRLYQKLNVSSNSNLIEKAIALDLLTTVPDEFIH